MAAALCASAEAPNLFTYQGRLKEGGQAVSGNRAVEIFVCNAESGPTCYTSGSQSVAVSNGLFRSTFSIPSAANFGAGDWWLEIKVGADTLIPRERLTSNAYSLFAATAAYAENISAATGSDGVYISSNLYVTGGGKYYGDGSQLQNLPVSGGAVAKTGDAMTGQLTLYGSTLTVGGNAFSVGGSIFRIENGKIGIGTIAPSGMLEINSTDNPQLLLTDLSGDVTLGMRYSNGAPRHVLGVPYYNDRVVLTNRNAPFPSQPDSAILLWDSGVTSLQMGTGGYLSFLAGTATEKARFTPQGNFGIGTTAPLYRLVVSSAAGEAGNMVVITTGTADVIRMTGAGEIYANYYHGDGSQLTGVNATTYTGTLPVGSGGTGATTVNAARTNLGLVINTDVQAHAAGLDDIAGLAVTNGNFIVGNGTNWVAESAGTARTSLGLGSMATQNSNSVSITGGAISGITDLAVADGGTGAGTAADARANLGLVIGTDVLAPNGDGSALTGVITSTEAIINTLGGKADDIAVPHLTGDETIGGQKTFSSTVTVNNTTLISANNPLLLSNNAPYGSGIRHDQAGNEAMIIAARNTATKIFLATGYDVSPSPGVSITLPASPEITVNNGRVGINKTAPDQQLAVAGNISQTGVIISSGTGNNYFAGNVGIGVTSPAAALEVSGDARIAKRLTVAANTGMTVAVGDFGKTITVEAATPQTITLPSVTAGDIGAQLTVVKLGAGTVTIQSQAPDYIADSTSGGAIYNDTAETYATITLSVTGADMWSIMGGNGSWTTN